MKSHKAFQDSMILHVYANNYVAVGQRRQTSGVSFDSVWKSL